MKKNKYKILVLSDLKKSTSTTLKSTVSLAKMINGNIEVFCVKKPTDIVDRDNQLSAVRTINREFNALDKKIKSLIDPISEAYGVSINCKHAFGNVKDEIKSYIEEQKPDIIVLGKRKTKSFNLIGDKITEFVLKHFSGVIMIANEKNALEPNGPFSLGLFNTVEQSLTHTFSKDLLKYTQKPIKSFKILKNSNTLDGMDSGKETVEYVFEHNDNAVKTVSNYVVKNKINLMCLDRGINQTKNNINPVMLSINEVMDNINVSLLISGEQQSALHSS